MNYFPVQVKSVLSLIDFSIFKKDNFGKEFIEDRYFSSPSYKMLEINNIKVNYGVTKLVFIPKKYNFVIKIPFKGCYECGSYYGSEEEEYDTYEEFLSFERAKYPLYSSKACGYNYCRSEAELYQIAKKEGFSQFLCSTEYFTTINDIPIYVSEKANVGIISNATISKEEKKSTSDFAKKNRIFRYGNLGFLNQLLKNYDIELVKNFFDFLDKYEMNSDLHVDNLGIRLSDEKPVIIDYSGFWD